MFEFIPAGDELEELQHAARCLKEANECLAKANKSVDAAKQILRKWLEEKRSFSLEKAPIGEFVHIKDVAVIEIGKMNKFDEKGFLVAEPALHAKWKRDIPVQKFKAAL